MMGLMRTLQPAWWFSAHLHCRFEATVVHGGAPAGESRPSAKSAEKTNPDEINIDEDEEGGSSATGAALEETTKEPEVPRNPDEIALDDEEDEVEAPPPPPPPRTVTNFLALDKCLPKRQFLEVRTLCMYPPTYRSD